MICVFLAGIVAGFFGSEFYRTKIQPHQAQMQTSNSTEQNAVQGRAPSAIVRPQTETMQADTFYNQSPEPVDTPIAEPQDEGLINEYAISESEADTSSAEQPEAGTEDPEYEEDLAEEVTDPEDIVIKKEQLLETRVVKNVLPPAQNLTDSVDAILEEHLSINPAIANQVVVEFWKSPVNFKGYKFNRKKLVLYGLAPQTEIKLCYYIHTQYMLVGNVIYKIVETAAYQPYQEVESETLKAHLRKYVG